jgi:hypothetical protein
LRCERGSVDVVCPPVLPFVVDSEEDQVRAVALDVHRGFCEVAILAEGRLRSAGRIQTKPEALELFAQSLDPRDWVALEVTGNAWAIARILEPHWSTNNAMRKAERELALQAQRAYERTIKDRRQAGASATAGRASSGSSKEQVARQTPSPSLRFDSSSLAPS